MQAIQLSECAHCHICCYRYWPNDLLVGITRRRPSTSRVAAAVSHSCALAGPTLPAISRFRVTRRQRRRRGCASRSSGNRCDAHNSPFLLIRARVYLGSGDGWGCSGVGDDFYSYGFDGMNMWCSGKSKPVGYRLLRKGDVVGCLLDLLVPEIRFFVNGQSVNAVYRNFNLDGFFFPVMSISAKVR